MPSIQSSTLPATVETIKQAAIATLKEELESTVESTKTKKIAIKVFTVIAVVAAVAVGAIAAPLLIPMVAVAGAITFIAAIGLRVLSQGSRDEALTLGSINSDEADDELTHEGTVDNILSDGSTPKIAHSMMDNILIALNLRDNPNATAGEVKIARRLAEIIKEKEDEAVLNLPPTKYIFA